MLNQAFNQKSTPPAGPRMQGQPVTNPKMLAAIAIKNNQAANQQLDPGPLAQAISKKKKKQNY